MITQKLTARKVSPLRGLLMVLGIVAAMFLMNVLGRLLRGVVPLFALQLVVIGIAVAMAFYLMKRVVIEYQYTVAEGRFFVERVYGLRSKVSLNVPLEDILFLGEKEAALGKWPGARVHLNATIPDAGLPVRAAAFRLHGEMVLALIQPDEALSGALFDAEKRKRAAQEKWGE